MTETTETKSAVPEALILDIAIRHVFIETLESRTCHQLYFHDVAVWTMRAALTDASVAGLPLKFR